MNLKVWMRLLLVFVLWWAMGAAHAADPCPTLAQQQTDAMVAKRVAAFACDEHQRWNRPFFDDAGHLASSTVYEAEDRGLKDGGAPWRRVAFYWLASGVLSQIAFKPGATDCNYAAINFSYAGMGCRGFVIDNPWSAAFISWVMQRAGVPGFTRSASHFDYVRAAYKDTGASPYRMVEPLAAQLQMGDMLCYVRSQRIYGYDGLLKVLAARKTEGLPMHCDIIVGVDANIAYAVGGNVQQAVTMRQFNLNAQGRLWNLPQRMETDAVCSPSAPDSCNFNRQDWVAVLKLKPQEALAEIGAVTPVEMLPQTPAPVCCVNCVLGSGVPRCPADGAPLPSQTPQSSLQGTD